MAQVAGALATVLAVLTPLQAHAQSQVAVDVRFGPTIAVGELAKVTSSSGLGLGIGLLYRVSPRVQLRTDILATGFERDQPGETDVSTLFLTFGPQLDLMPSANPWGLSAALGAGLALLETGPVLPPNSRYGARFKGEFLAINADLEGTYRLGETWAFILRLQLLATLVGDDLYIFQRWVNPDVGASGAFVSVPIEAGIRFVF